MRTAWTVLLAACFISPGGCVHKTPQPMGIVEDFERPLPPGELALRKITNPADMPDIAMACEFTYDMRQSVACSLDYLSKPSSQNYFPYGQITHANAVASLKAFDQLLGANLPPDRLKEEILRRFDIYTSVGWDGSGTVLFTSYYTPIFNASPTATPTFRYPLYKAPPGLVKDAEGEVLGIQRPGGPMQKLPARRDLPASGLLAGNELVYLADEFEVYIAHVQGSAKLRMPDGRLVTVGYAAHNGHDYQSIAKMMIDDGKLEKQGLSLAKMIQYFRSHPDEVKPYTDRNPRFVFFAISDGPPRGCLNEPVTAMRTIATDKQVYPRGCLAMVAAQLPQRYSGGIDVLPFKGFVLDQDSGGAIRAPGRCDLYVGVGDRAGELAGRTYSKGRLYYFFLKDDQLPPPTLTPTTPPGPMTTPTPTTPPTPLPSME